MSASEVKEDNAVLSDKIENPVQEDNSALLQRIDELEKKVSELESMYQELQENMNAWQQDDNDHRQPAETDTETTEPPEEKEENSLQEMKLPGTENLPEAGSKQPLILKKTSEASEEVVQRSEPPDELAPASVPADEPTAESAGEAASEQPEPEGQQPNQEENVMTTPEEQSPALEETQGTEAQPAEEDSSEFELEPLIADARAQEEAQLEEDRQQYDENVEEAHYWQELGQTLASKVESAAGAAQDLINESQHIVAALPEELQEALKNHQEGLYIIGRMLERLISPGERLKKLAGNIEIPGDLKVMTEDQWRELLEEATEKEAALKKLHHQLKTLGKENYRIVSMSNDLVKKRKDQLLSFLEKQVLPILDGVYDGQKHLNPRIAELQQRYPDDSSKLQAWLEIYEKLAYELEQVIEQVKVHEIEVLPGSPIDFERHEPFAIESDPEKEDEQIKEIARRGYEYTAHNGEFQVLRAAQVVVVKNEN